MAESRGALVGYEVSERTATLTLDSPRNKNALSRQLVAELGERLREAESDPQVRIALIRAEGTAFCSGADLAEARSDGMADGARKLVELQRQILALDKPVVARVHGAVRAGGIGIVASCDVAIATETATFALTEVRLGLAAAVISATVHHRMTPRAAALTTLGGEVFDGSAAAAYGLVTAAVPEVELDAEVGQVCAALAKGSPQGLRESKRVLNGQLLARIDAVGEELAALSARLFASDEAREAMSAFLDRRR